MATIFDCDWEDGSGVKNTGGTYVFDSETAHANFSENTSSVMWGSDCLEWDGSSSAVGLVTEDITDQSQFGMRIGLHVVSESIGTLQQIANGNGCNFQVKLLDNSGNLAIDVGCWNTGFSVVFCGPVNINTGTTYQILIKYLKNTSGGLSFEVWNKDGDTQIGSTQTFSGTTVNADLTTIDIGCTAALWETSNHAIDKFLITDQYAFPDKVTAGGGNSPTSTIYGPLVGPLGGPI